ncbi:hypothetical protein ABE132_14480 [Peribacillus simplex]|uniref:hypothetical protein n=1 Tax=Peribacillus simplex TaxID=1478 RepID=UPI003D2D92ED
MDKVKIKYDSLEFSELKSTFYGYNDFSFNWNQLIWAAITVGRDSWSDVKIDVNNYKKEIIFRKSMLDFAITVIPKTEKDKFGNDVLNFRPYTSKGFNCMDGSEKTAISYFMSTIFVKLFSARLLNCPWLMHLDRYAGRRFNATFVKGGKKFHTTKRPDLVGLRNGPILFDDLGNPYITSDWMAFESKGRSSRVKSALDEAKDQLENLDKINSVDPLRVALQTYTSKSNEIKVVWRDPESKIAKNSFCLTINKKDFLFEYYYPIYRLIVSNDNLDRLYLNENLYFTYEIDGTLKIGLRSDVFISMLFNLDDIYEQKNKNEDYFEFNEYEDSSYNWTEGSDGIIIGTKSGSDPFSNYIKNLRDNFN